MNPENPYQAPSASLGVQPVLEGDLDTAVEGLIATRAFIRVLAVLALICLACGMLALGAMMMTASIMPKPTPLLGIGWIVLMYGFLGIALFRLSTPLYALAKHKTWEHVTAVMQRMSQTWTLGIVGFAFGLLGGLAMRTAGPMAVIAGMSSGPSDTVGAARHLRTIIRIFVAVAVATMVANLVLTMVAPTASQLAFGKTGLWGTLAGGLLVQLIALLFIWRHVPALDAFIAEPGAATLAKVAHAHRMLWRLVFVCVLVLVAIAVIGIFAAITLGTAMVGR